MPDSDTESVGRSEVSAAGGGRRNRQRQRTEQHAKNQGGPLGSIGEGLPGGELVSGATDVVQNTVGNAVNQVGNTVGKTLGGLTGGGQKGEGDDKGEQLRLRLELNLDIEVQLKAKIHGDLTLGLLYDSPFILSFRTLYTDRDTATKRSCREVEDWRVRPRRSLKALIASQQFRKFWYHLRKT